MEVQGNGSIVHPQRHNTAYNNNNNNNNNNNVRYCYGDVRNNLVAENGCGTAAIVENSKKKTKKWSLSGLFKKRRTKSSDTDSSSEAEYKKGGLLSRNSHRRKGGSRKVVGKFEAIILPKDDSSTCTTRNGGVNLIEGAGAGGGVCRSNGIELYDASPNVIKRKRNKVRVANGGDGVSRSNQEICAATFGETGHDFDRPEMIKGSSGGSLDAAGRRNEKSKVKARVEAMRDRLRDESSSSSEEYASSCRNSNGSLPKSQHVEYTRTAPAPPPPVPVPGAGTGSWSRKSRAARTDRYAKRHHHVSNGEAIGCSPPFSNPDLTARPNYTPVGSPRSRWIAKVVYQQSNDYPMRYTARTHSATSSPMSSPLSKPKNFQSRSLPSKHAAPAMRSPPPSPPPPPPRNPNRKAVPSAAAADKYAIRPSSYAFDANARQKEISSYILSNEGNNGDDTRLGDDNLARFKSQSEMELRSRRYNAFPPSVAASSEHTYPKNRNRYSTGAGVAKAERKKLTNSANVVPQTPPLQSNVYINRNLYADEKPCPNYSPRTEFTRDFRFNDSDGPSLRKANEIGIPIVDASAPLVGSRRSKLNDRRPLSAVSEKSDNDVLAENVNVAKTKAKPKPKPRNLEEALVELEEIYNSLKLSDDDLLDRADRRDLQAAVKLHSNSFGRHWSSDDDDDSDGSNDEDVVDAAKNSSRRANRPRLSTSRRSAVPDAVTDDMAYRKLRRKVSSDVKSNPNLVSQSGSFLLMSPTFSPPPLVDVPPHSSSAMLFGGKEPDITLDDVVFRNIRHTNNTLKVSEPQPPFGIPLSPASPAPYSDYLHAVPSDKYRSTFNPSRTPDVVKDDLAFRNLRKDMRTEAESASCRREPVAVASKQRRAIRSLSANVVSLLGQRGKRTDYDYDYDEPVDSVCSTVNDSPMVTSNDRCASYNDLPCGSQDWRRVRQPPQDDVDETLDLVANETRALGKALEMKLRQLDAGTTPSAPSSNGLGKDVFAKRVVVHKPITLSRFEIAERDDAQKSPHWRPSQSKLVENTDTTESPTTNDTATDRGNSLVNSCPDFNWNDVRITNVQQQQPKRAEFGLMETSTVATAAAASATSSDLKSDKTENSSSGVSSTSNTPDSARKCHISASGGHKHDNSPATKVWYLDENVLPSFEHASRQFSQELRNVFECTDTDDDAVGNCNTNVNATTTPATTDVSPSSTRDAVARPTTVAPSNKKDFCSRIEITLATPQPAGVDQTQRRRWSSIETKDAAIMTEEFGLNGRIDCENRSKGTNGDTAQTRAARYKEERRKQLACQFNSLSRNLGDTSSSSSAIDDSLKKPSFRSVNSNFIKEDDAKKTKTQNSHKSTNKIRCKQSQDHSLSEMKSKPNGSVTSDSTATSSSKSCRDKSSKRKSYLNRSAVTEKTSNSCHTNRHLNSHSADEGGEKNCHANAIVASSLPCRVVASSATASTASTSSFSASSQKPLPSLSYTHSPVKATNVLGNSQSQISSHSTSNGFARTSTSNEAFCDKEIADKSKIPRRVHSPCNFSPRSFSHSQARTDDRYEDTCVEFRLKQVENVTLDDISNISSLADGLNNGHSSFNEYDLGDNSMSMSPPAHVPKKEKNSLLEIVQNFSDKNNAQNFAIDADFSRRHAKYYSSSSSPPPPPPPLPQSPPPSLHSLSLEIIEEDSPSKPSILKKKFDERSNSLDLTRPSSILKRKTSEDATHRHHRSSWDSAAGSGAGAGLVTPVRHIGNAKQGILKKHSSLDEQDVRRRSCSPDVDVVGHHQECKPILKSQRRRCSLEGLVRNGSPELHSILKRSKMIKDESVERDGSGSCVVSSTSSSTSSGNSSGSSSSASGGSPHGILKRKMFAGDGTGGVTVSSSLSSTSSSLDSPSTKDCSYADDTTVKPILKNKQHSFELAVVSEHFNSDSPRPILKKKHSVETDTDDEKPVKPILKSTHRRSLDESESSFSTHRIETLLLEGTNTGVAKSPGGVRAFENLTIKPILKKKKELLKASRCVKSDDDASKEYRDERECNFLKRHSLPVSSRLFSGFSASHDQSALSVAERIHNLENLRADGKACEADGAIVKNLASRNLRFSRNSERYKTQPITYQELFFTESAMEDKKPLSCQETNGTSVSAASKQKQSQTNEQNEQNQRDGDVLDDKAVISNLKRSNSVSMKASLFSKWQNHAKQTNEREPIKLKKNEKIAETRKLRIKCSDLASRFSTQPVTWEEVAEAKKQNEEARNKVRDTVRKEILQRTAADETSSSSPPQPSSSTVAVFDDIEEKKVSPLSEDLLNVSASFEKLQVDFLAETPSPLDVTIGSLVDTDISPNNDIDKLFDKIYLENSSETGSQSEGDTSSSGGREIQRIIGCSKQSSRIEKRDQTIGITKMNVGPIVSSAGADVVDDCPPVVNGNSSIAQRLAALQRSGQVDWKKRISRIVPENDLPSIININETQELLKKELTNGLRSGKLPLAAAAAVETPLVHVDDKKDGSLADRLEKLENASQTWKKRVEPSDAVQFSVAGKMASTSSSSSSTISTPTSTSSSSLNIATSSVNSPLSERKKRTPCPSRFRSFREKNVVRSTPISPEKSKSTTSVLSRSLSLPSDANDADETSQVKNQEEDKVVSVPQIFDQDFCTFFGNVDASSFNVTDIVEFASDFDDIKIEKPRLTCSHQRVRVQRKHATSGNPLKTLSTRVEIKNEYRETKTNIAEKEFKRMNVEKLSKSSNLAVEVLAGLASKEDFSAIHLKKAGTLISGPLLPYKPLMLLHVKGRRHVQTRLVEPVPQSVNSGDCYVLITPNEVYHWIGELCNVIEKSRGAEIAQHISTTHDLGCSLASQVHTIIEDSSRPNSKAARSFWTLLGVSATEAATIKAVPSGHPDEDEVYENSMISTNMIFEYIDDELVPYEKYWASIPKIQMLDPNKILVFDFGSEMYIWMGKNVDLKSRKSAVKLAEELWNNGYNYEECDLCPITSVCTIGDREAQSDSACSKKGEKRPEWCLLAKVTQHMETVLFREKFLDWPDFSRVIRAKGKDEDTEKQIDGSLDIKPCDAEEMISIKPTEPDLFLEGSHLGRGIRYFDEERRKFCLVTTSDVKMWHITEFESELVPQESLGQFYSTDSYVIRWIYSISYTGRELSGQPSKHTIMGRDRCVYFCWQGKNASLNEQGAAALLTVELDKEKGVQLRICQGYEPPAFFNLFNGTTVIYKNRKEKKWKLFVCRGEIDSEACLLEVSCNIKQLRSRASFVLLNADTGVVYVWNGSKVTEAASQACLNIANNLKTKCPPELGVKNNTIVDILQVKEGKEPKEFFSGLGSSSVKLYLSLSQDVDDKEHDVSPLLFNLSSNSGVFCATPIWSPCRHVQLTTAYPFLQEDLYSASQPALFLLDTGKVLWLWQGWWPERQKVLQEECAQSSSEEVAQNSDNFRGSATVRWQLERRAAMQTALDYWKLKYPANEPVKAFLVWAGLEPIQFTNLFPDWDDRDDIAEMNISDGRKPGEVLDVEQELARLTQSTYPIEQLLQRPLPDGVDPTKLELYLSPQHFKDLLKVTKEEFSALPSWKQTNLKKNAGLF
ncbi:uncharacterized protein LOC135839744 isoform X2 [Planococcus citri]|uniref:uncharacterized protein LOC135839744 isoform X2 n=1 Tax=Planococcus citri TaxID=170843 RepID=UPI0031F8E6E5